MKVMAEQRLLTQVAGLEKHLNRMRVIPTASVWLQHFETIQTWMSKNTVVLLRDGTFYF